MLRGSFQRAAMAILLMGMTIAPFGMCLQQSPKGAHSCCLRPEGSHSLRTDCCIVKTQLPAALAASTLPGTSSPATVHVSPMGEAVPISFDRLTVAVTPALSPPPRAFILRI